MGNHQRNVLTSYIIFGLSGLALFYIPTIKSIFLSSVGYLPWILSLLLFPKIRHSLKTIVSNKDQLKWALISGTLEGAVVLCAIQILKYPLGAENTVLASMWPLFMFLITVTVGLEPRSAIKTSIALLFALGLFLIKRDEFFYLGFSLGTLFVLIRILVSTYGAVFNKSSTQIHNCSFSEWMALIIIRWIPMMIIALLSFIFYEKISIEDLTKTNVLFYLIYAGIGGILAHYLILSGIKALSFFELLSFSTIGRFVTIVGFIVLGNNELTPIKFVGMIILLIALTAEKIISKVNLDSLWARFFKNKKD